MQFWGSYSCDVHDTQISSLCVVWACRTLLPERWTIWDVPVNKGFCVRPVLSVWNLFVLGRQSPLEGSSLLPPFSPFASPRGGSAGPPETSTIPDLSERDPTVTPAKRNALRCCTGIALSSEKTGKSWCSAMSSEQLGLMLFQRDCCCCRQKAFSLWPNTIKHKIFQFLPLC